MEDGRFEQFMLLTGSIAKSIQRLKTTRMQEFELSASHTDCLCHLLAGPAQGLTQGELTLRLQMDRAQVSRVLRELKEKGLVAPDSPSGYKSRYALTAPGLDDARRIRAIISDIHHYVIRDIPQEDIDVFNKTLRAISDNLGRAAMLYHASEQE